MTRNTLRRVHLAYAWALGGLILATGVGLAVSCLAIYRSGLSPFTRESISLHFSRISPLVYACLIGAVGGWVLSLVLPCAGGDGYSGRVKAMRDPSVWLKKQTKRLNTAAVPPDFLRKMKKERTLRRLLAVGAAVACGAIMLAALIYCLAPARFSVETLNADVAEAARVILLCGAVSLTVATAAVLAHGASIARELVLMKAVAAEAGAGVFLPADDIDVAKNKKLLSDNVYFVWTVRGLVAAAGIAFVLLGVLNGGMADVLGKAIRICTECIGLG